MNVDVVLHQDWFPSFQKYQISYTCLNSSARKLGEDRARPVVLSNIHTRRGDG